jgi:hypothetical protein
MHIIERVNARLRADLERASGQDRSHDMGALGWVLDEVRPTALRCCMRLRWNTHGRGGDYFGSGVNRAARLMWVAHGGQILVSGVTKDLLVDAPVAGIDMVDLELRRLKDLADPMPIEIAANTADRYDAEVWVYGLAVVGERDAVALAARQDIRCSPTSGSIDGRPCGGALSLATGAAAVGQL